ncbi:hypothetical protein PoB_005925100 [Plakobranchus ocellatus]|uniref:Uncharacterized protein n=1 Tax=Plakobranchus ocellatus TaxID=259542 RepID=A0AAV4CLW0_9GAST|nr:hypothetical protein PoB_005925100 [Plakobranchus ocellatus]
MGGLHSLGVGYGQQKPGHSQGQGHSQNNTFDHQHHCDCLSSLTPRKPKPELSDLGLTWPDRKIAMLSVIAPDYRALLRGFNPVDLID